MKNQRVGSVASALLSALFATLAGTARADVTMQHSTSVEGAGAMSLANMTGTSTTVIARNQSRIDTDLKMQSKVVGFLARNALGPTADIVSLDDGRIVHLNLNRKEYTETSFEQMREQQQKALDQADQQQARQPSAVDQSKCEWLPAKVTSSRTGEKGKFAGYDAERDIITAVQPCKDKETGAVCDIVLVLDQWLAPNLAESAEVRRYYDAYAAKMGMDAAGVQDASQRAKALFGQYKGLWSEVATKMQNAKGYPVKTGFTLAMGGEQCKDPKARQARSGDSADSDGSAGPGGLTGAIAGRLGGLLHKKKQDDASTAAPGPAAAPIPLPPGDVPLITVTSQLVSISSSPVPADMFMVPAGFRKTEAKTAKD